MPNTSTNPEEDMLSIVFIDSRVQDYELLIAGLGADVQVVVLDPTLDGVIQMATALAGVTDLDSIHIVSHGASGTLYLGSTVLTEDNLDDYESELALVGEALSEKGDLLIYGCDVAAGPTGQSFIANLADHTGADVAASDNQTGNSLLGGDWTLEVHEGAIQSRTAIAGPALNYAQLLVTETLIGNSLANHLTGNSNSNILDGGGGNDTLNGLGGQDTLIGGAGNDTLRGGSGDDVFIAGGSGTDLVADFEQGDRIRLAEDIALLSFGSGNGSTALSGEVQVLLSLSTTTLFFGLDGIAGADLAIKLNGNFSPAYFEESNGDIVLPVIVILGSALDDILTGTSADDSLKGFKGNDQLEGLQGEDSFDGGPGADTLIGGRGNDIYVVTSTSDVVRELASSGIDEIWVNLTLPYLADNVENLWLLGEAALDATGNNLANVIYSNSGNNILTGGAGKDTADYRYASSGVIVDLTDPGPQETLGSGIDTLNLFESISGSAYHDHLTGNNGQNRLSGENGNDTLLGLDGPDSLLGGNGNDTLRGGADNDFLQGGLGRSNGHGVMDGGTGDDDFIVGESANVIMGGTGRDSYQMSPGFLDGEGEVGGDVIRDFVSGPGGDRIVFDLDFISAVLFGGDPFALRQPSALEDIVDTVLATINYILEIDITNYVRLVQVDSDAVVEFDRDSSETRYGWITTLTLNDVNVTDLTADNFEGVTFTGTAEDDTLVGALGNDTLEGLGGDDILQGSEGADSMVGGSGSDTYSVDDPGDLVVETDDPAALPDGPTAIVRRIGDTIIASIEYSLSGIAFVENLTLRGPATSGSGNELNNVITGSGLANTLFGLTGTDTLLGAGGNDQLTGGAGADRFEFGSRLNSTDNVDRIIDFDPDEDLIRLDNDVFRAFGTVDVALGADAFRKGAGVKTAADAEDRILYNTTTGKLYYDPDGTGDAGARLFAVLAGEPSITAADFFIIA